MKKQSEYGESLVRSGTRIRESVRSLPKGHFQQIRQMFEKQTCSTKKLSTIYEQQQKSLPSNILLGLSVTDDEKLERTTTKVENEKSIEKHHRDYISEYQSFRIKLTNTSTTHKTMCPLKEGEQLLKQQISPPQEKHLYKETLSPSTPLTHSHQQELYRHKRGQLSKSEAPIFTKVLSNNHHPIPMSNVLNYTDSYDSLTSNSLHRSNSSRYYTSSLQNVSNINTETMTVTTHTSSNSSKDTHQSVMSNEACDLLKSSRRLHSSTSLSSTGYDSNSSPSMKSKRNSTATSNSNDCIIHSTYSSSSSSSPSSSSSRNKQEQEQEQEHEQQLQLPKPWIQYESNTINPSHCTSHYHEDAFESSNESSPMVSRTEIKLAQPTTIDHRPVNVVCHAIVCNSILINSPSSSSTTVKATTPLIHVPTIATTKSDNLPYSVQTTSFPDYNNKKVDKKIHRWNNIYSERIELANRANQDKRYPILPTSSTGFQVINFNNEQDQQDQQHQTDFDTSCSNFECKSTNVQVESPVSEVESSVLCTLPPKKPPRTFQQGKKRENTKISKHSKIITTSTLPLSHENSPTLEFGTRSVSCMDLTANVANVALPNNRLLLKQQNRQANRSDKTSSSNEPLKPSALSTITSDDNAETYLYNSSQSELNTVHKNTSVFHTPTTKFKTSKKSDMKKGVSEPNLMKTTRSKSPFSPRSLLDRFKRMLPTSLSKQSLNEKTTNHNDNVQIQNDSDDTGSTTSENNDQVRTSKLDHVSRVQNVYESLNTSNRMSNLLTDPSLSGLTHEITTLYDYVVHILPEQEIGYFSNGNGCLSSSNINHSHHHQQEFISTSTPIRFKYPPDAQDEKTLKYFCFPDQLDTNNNPILAIKKSSQEYFRFTLTNMHGIRQFGYCSRFFHKGIMNALCIISPYDMIEVYEKILSTATELFLSYKDNDAKTFLEEIYYHRLPNRGDTIYIPTSTVGLYTLKCEFNRRKVLIDSVALLALSTETIIKIFSAILYEQKIIFIGNELGTLTRLINTFICLLYPFSWPHTYVPILPALMLDVIQAPTPYIIGILRSCESYLSANDDLSSQDNSDILIVDIDNDRIRSMNDYVTNKSYRGLTENLQHFSTSNSEGSYFQILPKIFKIELKQEISLLCKVRSTLSLEECQQRLHDVFMSIFVQSCYNYKDYFDGTFHRQQFLQSKQHTIELFLEWFTRTQIFGLFIRQKFEYNNSNQYALTFDSACEKYSKTLVKHTPQRITAKAVKRKSATRANKQDNQF